jgi:hypothetical protein
MTKKKKSHYQDIHLVEVHSEPSGQRGPLPYEDNEPSRSPGRLFLLSIPDMIRDPEGKRHQD